MALAVLLLAGMAVECVAEDISLDGRWTLSVNDATYEVDVPHTYNLIPGLEDYAGTAVYERRLPVDASWKGRQARLHFKGVNHDAVVYVNGRRVGEHMGKGYTPWSLDITPFVDVDRPDGNVLRVECSNAYSAANLPYQRKFDWSNDGGIYRSVRIHLSGRHMLRYVHVTPQVVFGDSAGRARFDVRLFDERVNKIALRLRVTDRQTGQCVWQCDQRVSKKPRDTHFTLTADFGKVRLWHFDNPNLYDFTCEVYDGGRLSDSLSDHFGFRELRVEGRGFVFNGEPVRLPGIEAMPGSNPRYGMAEPLSWMQQTVKALKDLNCTITRFHWVQDEDMLTLLDEHGILAQEELSWWQQPRDRLSPVLQQIARETLEEMIEAHYNHPCLYGWGLSNEVVGNTDDLVALAAHVRTIDNTRIIDALCNRIYKEMDTSPSLRLDLPTWNEYIGTWHGRHRDQLPGFMRQVDSLLSDRPLFITEHGLCEPAFVGGDSRRIDDMLFHVKEWQRWPFVCGYIYFCLQDYRTQMGEEGLGKWRIRRHGLTTTDLTPKASYHVFRQLTSPIEIVEVGPANARKKQGSLAEQYELEGGQGDARVVLAVKNTIPSYVLRGYSLNYKDDAGNLHTVTLPTLHPGERHPLLLKDINSRYAFSVTRPDGTSVIDY